MATPAETQQSGHPRDAGPAGQQSGDSAAVAAVVLAGGRATRLGGVDKPALVIAGRSLLSTAVNAATSAGARRVVIVGPPRPGLVEDLLAAPLQPADPRASAQLADLAVDFTTEQPPGAGPVQALRAGLELVSEPWLVLLAADLPFLRGDHLSVLLTAARQAPGASGAIFDDEHGHLQWLAGCWQTVTLRTALAEYEGSSLGGLLGPLRPVRVAADAATATGAPGAPPPWLDCDTSDDLAAAAALAAAHTTAGRTLGGQGQPTGE